MALYTDTPNVVHVKEQDAFTVTHGPGSKVQHSGIYRCINCGDENACNKGDSFPPQNTKQHTSCKAISWRLLVFAQQKG